MLLVSGKLNFKMGGPSIFPELPAEMNVPRGGWPVTADPVERCRRSIYVFAKRNQRYPLFGAFDAPEGNETCSRRHISISAPQALMLLNGKITLDWSRAFAGRVLSEVGSEPGKVVEQIYRLALGRLSSSKEQTMTLDFLDRQRTLVQERLTGKQAVLGPVGAPSGMEPAFGAAVVDLCHVLFNVNEFAYID